MKIAVIGSGGWGTAIAKMLSENNNEVSLWSFLESEAEEIRLSRGNMALLPGISLSDGIFVTSDISCAEGAEIIVMATPSFAVFETAQKLLPYIDKSKTIVIVSKGFDYKNGYALLSQTLEKVIGDTAPVVALTGPSHAEEVARGMPTAVVAASKCKSAAEKVQSVFMNNYFRVYTTPDIIGAEVGGAMKNIIALSVGIADGIGYGDNTRALLMTRGIAEMTRFGIYLGGISETFSGLSGIGDLVVTCTSRHSRNRRAGLLIGGGMDVEQALQRAGGVVEGYYAAKAVKSLTTGVELDLPISSAMYGLLFEREPIGDVISSLISRDKKAEIKESWMEHITW